MKLAPEPKPRRGYKVQCAECGGKVLVDFFYKGKRYINVNPDHDLCKKCWRAHRNRIQAVELG